MQFSTLALAALSAVASAQKVTVVQVGRNSTQTFSPNEIRANVGEMVQFQFMGGNHTVTQSNFANPCMPINMINSSVPGFHSGFVPAAASQAMGMIPTYTIMVNSTAPIWIYCAQGRHCEGGMSMVINVNQADPTKSLAAYKALSLNATTMIPGGPSNGGSTGSTTGTPGSGATTPGAGSMVSPSFSLLAVVAAGYFFL